MRKYPFAVLAVCLLLFGALVSLLRPWPRPPSTITRANYDRIKLGMTEAEFEDLLGCPSVFYTDRPVVVLMSAVMVRRWWVGDEGVLGIELDLDTPDPYESIRTRSGRVIHKHFSPLPPESFGEKLRRRLERRWDALWRRGGR